MQLATLAPPILGLCALLGGAPLAAQDRPPSAREQLALAKEYLGLDGRVPAERRRQLAVLERLDRLKPLRPSDIKSWRKKLEKAFSKGKRLEAKAGNHHYWEEEGKGFYILGGKLSKKPQGLLIGLHGGGKGSGSARGAYSMLDGAAKQLGWVAIFPQVLKRTERGWTDSGTEEWVLDLIAAARRTWKIPADRVYMAGHSMGGYGTWTIGAHHADMFAGLGPSAGAPTPILDSKTHKAIDIVEGVVPCLRNTRLVIYQSDDDPRVPPDANRVAAQQVKAAQQRWGGFDHEYWEVTGRGHAGPPGGAITLLRKIEQARRQRFPERIVWQPSLLWKRHFYWLHWESPPIDEILVADLDRKTNTVTLTCAAPMRDLQILVDEEMLDVEREVVVRIGEREVYRGKPEPRLSVMLMTSVSGDPGRVFTRAIRVPH